MIPVFTVLFVVAGSLAVIRIASVALTMTGLSRDLAQFQALSAFTTSGFTTREAEDIVTHPVRRRIVMHLMLLGNAGVIIVIPSVILSFLTTKDSSTWWTSLWFRACFLGVGIVLLLVLANSKYVEAIMWRFNTWALRKWTRIEVHDYMGLLRLTHEYTVSKLIVEDETWLSDHTLSELSLANEGILVLGIERGDNQYLGAPRGSTQLKANDVLVLYGRQDSLADLASRRAGLEGNMKHVIAVTRQIDVEEVERGKLNKAD